MTTPGGGSAGAGDLGVARGKIVIDAKDAQQGAKDATEAVEQFQKKAKTSGDQGLKDASNFAKGYGTVVAGGIALAVNAAANFEQALANVAAAGGKDAANQMDQLRAKALQLGADTKFSATEAANAMEVLIKAGLSVQDVLNGAADAAVNLAAAEGITIPEAAEIAAVAMTAFNLKASDMPAIANKISQAASATKMNVNDFSHAMNQAGAVSKLVGLSFEDMTLAITAMGKAGIVGSDAGTSLKTMLMNLQPSTKSARNAMHDLGLLTKEGANQFFNARGEIKSMTEISELLYQATRKLTPAQRQQALETIFGSDAIRAAAIIAEQGAVGMNKLTAEMQSQLSVAEKARVKQDTLQGSLEKLKGSVEAAAIRFGTVFIPVLTDIVRWLEKVADWFGRLPKPVQEAAAWFATISVGLIALGLVFSTINKAVVGLVAVFKVLGLALTAHPVLLIAAIIAAAVAAIIVNWDVVEKALSASWNFLKNLAITVWTAVRDFFVEIFTSVRDFVVGVWEDISLAVSTAWTASTTSLKTSTQALGIWFRDTWNGIASFFVNLWNDTLNWLSTRWSQFTGWLDNALTGVGHWFRDRWNSLAQGAVDSWNWLGDQVSNIGNWLKIRMGNFGSTLWNHGRDLIVGLWEGIKATLGWLWDNVKRIGGDILNWFKDRLGIGSPSKYTIEYGEWLTLGLGVGVEKKIEALKSSITKAGQVIEPTLAPYVNPVTQVMGLSAGSPLPPSITAAPGSSSSSRTIVIERLEVPIKATLDPTNAVQWREAMRAIRDGVNNFEREYGGI